MKTRFIKSLLAMVLTMLALPMIGQDFMNVYFKDGTFRKFYLKNITEITTSKYDADSVMHFDYDYQHVTTLYDKYIYSLEDVDSITFTKYDEELVIKNMVSATNVIFPTISECESVEDAENVLNTLKEADGIENAWCEGNDLYVKIKDWVTMSFHFNHESNSKDGEASSRFEDKVNSMVKQIKKSNKNQKLKAVIANQTHYDERPEVREARKKLEQLKEYFGQCNIDTHYVDKPTIFFFAEEIYDYDIVVLCTHGGYKNGFVHTFITGEELGRTKKNWQELPPSEKEKAKWKANLDVLLSNKIFKDYTDQHVEFSWVEEERNGDEYWVGYPRIIETFIEKVPDKNFNNPNSVLFSLSCHSLEGNDSLAHRYFKRGLGVYYGYNKEVTFKTAAPAALNFFQLLLNGNSLYTSTLNLPSKYKIDDYSNVHAQLNVVTNPDYSDNFFSSYFLAPTYTNEISQETAQTQYNYSNYVEVEGYATILDNSNTDVLNALSFGFEYGGKYDPSWTRVSTTEKICLTKTIDKGNILFRAQLKNLNPDQTYCYRAYTNDGNYYNYGEPCEFTLETLKDFELSTGSFCIVEGKSTTIDITGNGEYDIFNGNEKVTKVTLEGEKLIIEAIGAGESTIIVTDKKTGKTAPIEVTVWARLSVAIIGNIDLEVGASADVRIISGNGDYKLESSDPDVATPSLVGEFVKVDALSSGTATITVTDNKTGQTASFTVTVAKPAPIYIPAEPINLGLPSGTLWASWNVGATAPEEYGDYFSWGETEVRDQYYFTTYSLCDGTVSSCHDIGADISGTQYDVAHVKWGGGWCMPSKDDFMELVYNCEYKETTQNGVKGLQFTGKNGNYIFLPYTGYYWNTENSKVGSEGSYWSSTLTTSRNHAHEMNFSKGEMLWDCYINRFAGLSVRPVKHSTPTYDNLVLSTYDPIIMNVSAGATFMILSGSGSYAVESSNEAVATVKLRDNKYVDVSGMAAGTTIITVIDTKSDQKKTIEVTIIDKTPLPDTPAEVVDLGLPSGTKWASYNLGATRPEDFGGYYAWGELEARTSFEWDEYKYYNSTDGWIHISEDIGGTNYDVARKLWGESWSMPTTEQFRELKENCTMKETEVNGVYGRMFTGKNGNSIFLPAGGSFFGKDNTYKGSYGYYWSSTLSSSYEGNAQILFFKKRGELMIGDNGRAGGLSVRPVTTVGTPVANLVLDSTAPLSLKMRQSTDINIISGSGTYTVKSSDEAVATAVITDWVSLETMEKGKCVKVDAVGVGTATITVTDTHSRQQVSLTVTVKQNVDLLKLSVSSLELKVGETGDVVITSSSGAQYAVATSDASVATFSIDKTANTIKVIAVGAGTCNVTVNDSETGETATVEIEVVKKPIDPNTSGWVNLISNSDMEGSDVSCFFERTGTYEKDPYPATISDGVGKNGSRGIKVAATARKEENYDNQFWFRMNKPVSAGTKYRFSFDYRADKKASVDMEMHSEPGEYITYNSSWGLECTSGWKTYTVEGIVSSSESPEGNPLRSVAFDLSTFSAANNYYFDNIKFEVAESSAGEDGSFTVYGVKFNMIPVQGGTYMMGADDDDSEASEVERPRHEVTVNDFAIGQTEVTQRLWKAVMDNNPSNFVGDDLPVENITWDQCQTFISKLNALGLTNGVFRLPTEAEWEFAARGGNKSKGYAYSGSNSVGDVAWYGGSTTHPVGQKDCNELGLYDMSGNVWEWCHDWYDEEYYASSPKNNPTGPSSGEFHVRRGGRWDHTTKCCRVSSRNDGLSEGESNYDGSGFRLALVK